MPPVKMKGLAKPKNTKKVILELLKYMGSYKALWFVVMIFVLASSLLGIAGSYMIKPALNDYIIPLMQSAADGAAPDFSGLAGFCVRLALIYLLSGICSWSSARLQLFILTRCLYKIRVDLFERIQSLPLKFFDGHPHGEIMSRFTNDTDTLRDLLSQTLPRLLSGAVTVTGVFVMMIRLSVTLTLLVLLIVALMLVLARRISARSAAAFKQNQKNIGALNGYIEEMMEGSRVVKIFGYEQKSLSRFAVLNDALREAGTEANTYGGILGPVSNNLSHAQYSLVAMAGAALVIAGKSDIGSIAAFLQYTREFSRPISMFGQLWTNILNALAGAERVFDTLEEIPENDGGSVTLVNAYEASVRGSPSRALVQSFARTGEWAWKNAADNSLKKLEGHVVFRNVDFSYVPEKQILFGINIEAKPGEKIALVGSTGSGKTTITNLLNRFYEIQSGEITYDGIPVQQIKKDDLRRSLAMVLQDTHLFSGTIYDNIKYGNLEASRSEVEEAARLANADYFIRHLEDGYDTVITGDGASLSQGQRQLLAIARAAVANPPVLILDEATSSIDTRTEKLIQDGMDALMKGRTVFVIAHRLSTVVNSDKIIVLEHGKIIEQGSHEALIKKRGKYYRLYSGGASSV